MKSVVLRRRANLWSDSGGSRFDLVATPKGCSGEQKSRLLRRVRHVVAENCRVLYAVSARRQNDPSDSENPLPNHTQVRAATTK